MGHKGQELREGRLKEGWGGDKGTLNCFVLNKENKNKKKEALDLLIGKE